MVSILDIFTPKLDTWQKACPTDHTQTRYVTVLLEVPIYNVPLHASPRYYILYREMKKS